ncbi:MAG: ribosome small subunit-dependent GTPase A [Fibrella sp.]|nr:ribosome small subunit-dependent GTPase A [Armatimonadota bacterium]
MSSGVVVRAGRGLYTVQTDTGRVLPCGLRGNLKKNLTYPESANVHRRVEKAKKRRETNPLAIGDRVEIEVDETGMAGVIETIEPRTSALTRRSGNERERQTIVANLDLAIVTFALRNPQVDPWKLDRFLVLAEDAEVKALVVLNKIELADPADLESAASEYRRIGYEVMGTSAKTGEGIEALRERLKGKIAAFCGPSGVGKSSLLNALQPGLKLKTAEVGDVTHLGRHTTVAAELIPLNFGGWLADTPGLRQVEFWDLPLEDVAYCFPEIEPLMGQCKFTDCRHRTEPGCAILAAKEHGDISERRYLSYIQMTEIPTTGSSH